MLQYCSCCVTSHICQRVNTGESYIFYFGYLYAWAFNYNYYNSKY